MTSSKLVLLLGAAWAVLPAAALAQAQTPQPSQTPAPAQQRPAQTPAGQTPAGQTPPASGQPASVGDVTVTARADDVRTSIDSVSYSLANDLQATSGSLADALRNVNAPTDLGRTT
jgi:hypothetical protein